MALNRADLSAGTAPPRSAAPSEPNRRVNGDPHRLHPWVLGVLLACVVALAFDLPGYPLLDPDEGRNAEVAREMAATGDFALPRLNGIPYIDKPVLFFAVTAMVMKLFGATVLAARLPPLVFTLATLAVVAWFGRRLFGRDGAWIAAIATAATPFSLAYARTVIFDSMMTFFVVTAVVAFYVAIEKATQRTGGAEWWTTLAWVAMAFGVLTKGPIALAIPLFIVVPFAVWQRTVRILVDPMAILLFAVLVAPWVFMMQREVPGYLGYVVGTETIGRIFTDDLQRDGPIWYFLVILPAAALPWTVVAAAGARRAWKNWNVPGTGDHRIGFLLIWIVVPLVFFSLAQSKRPQYILPLVPAVGLIVAAVWTKPSKHLTGAKAGAAVLIAFAFLLFAGNRLIPGLVSAASPATAAAIPGTAITLALGCAVGGAVAWWGRARREILLAAFALPVLLIPVVSRALMDEIGRERSAAELARAVEPHVTASTQIIGVQAYPLSLPFYLQQTLMLSTLDGSELTSNYVERHVDDLWETSETLRPIDWWREAIVNCNRPRVFVFRSEDRTAKQFAEEQLGLIIDTGKYAAYGPCGTVTLARSDS